MEVSPYHFLLVKMKKSGGPLNWRLYSVIIMLQIVSAFAMFSYIPLLLPIANELHLSSSQIGFLATTGALGGIIFGIFSGWLVDRIRTIYMILLGPGLITISLFFFSLSHSYFLILLANLFLGIGYTIVLPLTSRLIVFYFPRNQMVMLISLKQSGSTIGQSMGGFLLPITILSFSWRFSLSIVTILMVIVVLFCFVYFFSKDTFYHSEKKMRNLDIPKKQPNKVEQDIKHKFPKEAFFLFIMGFAMLGYQASFSAFLIPFLNEEKGINYAISGALLGISQLVGAFSRPFLGWLSDVVFHGSRKKLLVICGFGNVISSLFLVYLPESYIVITILLLIILGITCYGWAGIYFAYIVEIFGNERSGLGTGYGVMVNCLGAAACPLIFGFILDSTSYKFSFTVSNLFILVITFLIFYKLTETRVIKENTGKVVG
jgi:MFS family permease